MRENYKIANWWSRLSKWEMAMCVIVLLWIIAQGVLVILTQNLPQFSDPEHYLRLALECADSGGWYPTPDQTWHSSDCNYIVYAGYINYEAAVIKLTGDFRVLFWLNIFLNCVLLASVWSIILYLAGRTVAAVGTIIYCLAPWTVYWAATTMSDLPCMALIYLSVALLGRRKAGWLAAAGVIIALAQYVRSIAILFAVASLIFMLIKRYNIKGIIAYCASGALTLAAVLILNYNLSGGGKFVSATTFGINFVQGANDMATGGYCGEMFETPRWDTFDQTDMDVFARDSVYKDEAVEWIKSNPGQWLALAPRKVRTQLSVEHALNLRRADEIVPRNSEIGKFATVFLPRYSQIYHLSLYLLAIAGIWIRRRRLWGVEGVLLLPYLGSIFLAVVTVGGPRYQSPFAPVLTYFAAFAVLKLWDISNQKFIRKKNHG